MENIENRATPYPNRAQPWASKIPANGIRFRNASAKQEASARGHWNDMMAKKFLVRLSTTPHRAFRPADGNQILAENIALRVAGVLHHLAQLHVVEHVEAQSLICAQRLRKPSGESC